MIRLEVGLGALPKVHGCVGCHFSRTLQRAWGCCELQLFHHLSISTGIGWEECMGLLAYLKGLQKAVGVHKMSGGFGMLVF